MAQVEVESRQSCQFGKYNKLLDYDRDSSNSEEDSCYETNDDNGGERTYSSLNSNEHGEEEEALTWVIEEKSISKPTTEKVLAELEINHLKSQIYNLKQSKLKLEKQFRQKCAAEQRVLVQLRQLKVGSVEKEHKILAEARRETTRTASKISRLELQLERRKQEVQRVLHQNRRLEQEKESLLSQLCRWKQQGCDLNTNLNLNKKIVSERERSLVRKSSTLTNQIGRLERQCKTLQAENDHLKKKMEVEKERPRNLRTTSDKEVHLLKRKKDELTTTVSKLQEKLKVMQKETTKNATLEKSIQTLKKDFECQRSKDEAEHAQLVQDKDREIESLKERCNHLCRQLEEISKEACEQGKENLTNDGNEIEKILQQAAKERLSLEHQVKVLSQRLDGEVDRFTSLEETNASLVHRLEELQGCYQNVEKELEDKKQRCEELSTWLENKSQLCTDLETQLRRALDRSTQLSILNSDLQKQIESLQNVNEECKDLRSSLGVVESDCESAKLEVGNLHSKVDNLESVLRQMREAAEKRKELEREHAEAYEQLVQRQEEVKKLHKNQTTERNKNQEIIENLQSKLRELDRKCELQNVRHEELILEMAAIKRSQGKGSSDWSSSPTPGNISQEVQTSPPENGLESMESTSGFTGRSTPNSPHGEFNTGLPLLSIRNNIDSVTGSLNSPKLTSVKTPCDMCGSMTPPHSNYSTSAPTCMSPALTSTLGRSSSPVPSRSRTSSPLPSATSAQIDLIMAKIEQDNKILAELDKTRATIGLSSTLALGSTTSSILTKTASDSSDANYLSSYQSPIHNISKLTTTTPTSSHLPSITTTSIPTIITTSYDSDKPKVGISGRMLASTPGHAVSGIDAMSEPATSADYLDVPGKGRVQVYIARYTYDPLQHSPNENPEAELAVNAGEYIYVVSGMDEDGFYEGELMNGRKGLVPSNFVERLKGEDLLEFQKTVLYGLSNECQNVDMSTSDDNQVLIGKGGNHGTSIIGLFKNSPSCFSSKDEYRKAVDLSFINLWDLEEEQDELHATEQGDGADTFFSVLVPAPQKLTLERQLHKSILISWTPPDVPNNTVESYDVYVDGLLNTSVKATERTRALIEGVDSAVPHRISVRSVTGKKRTSRDAACTMVIGQNIPIAPSCVRATSVTATSAVISWLPSNSNYQHGVCVNNVEVRLVKPGVYRHTITGLTPNTTYRVSVRVKNIKVPMAEDKPAKKLEMISSFVDFKTLQVGLPDPPLDIQVEAGPQDGTLLVTWLPVTINDAGTSNGAPVTGYAVYADGKKLIDIDSPTGDHALLDLTSLQGTVPKAITVRTKSYDSLSPDSMATKIPVELIKRPRKSKSGSASSLSSTDDSDSEPELVQFLMQAAHKIPTEFTIYGFQKGLVDGYLDSSDRSELSDIAEEAEEELSDTETKDAKNGGRDHGSRDHRTSSRAADSKDGQEKMSRREGGGGRGRDDRGGRDTRSMQQAKGGRDYPPVHDSRGGRGPPRGEPRSPRMPHDDRPPAHVDIRRREVGGRPHRRYDSHGQMIIEPEENLSDKEVYPHQGPTMSHMSIPSIEITKDSASEGRNSMENYSDEEYGMGRNGMRGGRKQPPYHEFDKTRGHPPVDHGGPRSPRDHGGYYDRGEWGGRRDNYHGGGHYTNDYSANRRRTGAHDESLRPRFFRAIFDYDPQTMSPNPNAADEELPFQEGQIIKIFGDMDPDGFYLGEAHGKKGYVPGNMVTELPPDQSMVDHPQGGRRGGDRWGDDYANTPRRKMVALYDYDPQELSPNVDAEAELSFSTGEVIYVYGDMDEDGFFLGEINGVRGLVPSNFLTEAPPDYREAPRRTNLGPHDTLPPAAGKRLQKAGSMADRGEAGSSGGRRPSRQGVSQHQGERYLHLPQQERFPKTSPNEVAAPGHADSANPSTNHNQQPNNPAADPAANRQQTRPRPDGLMKPSTTSSIKMPNNFLKPEIIPDAPTTTLTTNTTSSAPNPAPAPRGLLATMNHLAAKLSPMENITSAWDQVSGGGSANLDSNKQKTMPPTSANAPDQAGAGGGFFQSLLGFAKRAT